MSLQPDINALLHNMRAQIQALTSQLAELQANPPAATPSVEKKFNKKVEVVADPGTFEGDRALQECYTTGVWPTWDDLKVEIEKYFKPQAEHDWARQQIRSFKQGNMRTDDFVTRFLALSIQGGLGNEHAVELLERNVNPHIAEQLYLQDMRNENLSQAAEEVWKIGRAIELYKMHQGGETTKNNQSQRCPGSSNHQNHSHRFKLSGCNQGREPPWISVWSKEDRCADSRGTATIAAKKDTWRQARQSETEKPDNQLNTLAGRSYEEIRVFFYDQQVNEMKAQGKEFGA
ncbi:hypothetical protein SERLA73DRAFT_71797 [Serpula lacrymans var. lacrymans S7.3]|uniref:Retrotransposon gag domain-containing protein n=2 Tax=Serpula lacrymans var. lacrymans TaxID=341189 RepID=F8PSX2_SERL3|nr:uncharacterized protein SERLADRAFT_436201 [Serpula lacrymans var. lacrymans S7.9]EGO00830.1 hypothetical protein SERLA73DRAFT_71797 [Serpula lacrymans var. lacrymans S7.3]EGO26386.1 hypothetical protein SERLADRAFT_436201 [Serpula lacrymans var. lacrymans S7.9]